MIKKLQHKERTKKKRNIWILVLVILILSSGVFFLTRNWIISAISLIALIILSVLYPFLIKMFKKTERITRIESVFPDFLQLMASNLRAGMTIDRAMLLSSRKEFYPLDEEVLKTGKDITTGTTIELSLSNMSQRIGSEKIDKTISLIISGIKAGGDLAVLLGETARNMREKDFVQKKAASSVLMYIIFIFIAVSIGAPVLFSLSTILVETLTNLLSGIPVMDSSQINLPFTLSSISISVTFVKYFSIIFLIAIDLLASLILGLVSKGEEKQGLKYFIPLLAISLGIFFTIRLFLSGFLKGLFI